MSGAEVVLRTDSIGKAYGTRRVLRGAYFQAAAGEVTALLGRNGAGKSTLLKIAAGWVSADHGFVEFQGRRHLRPNPAALAREGLFLLPVDRSPLVPRFTLAQHLDALVARFACGGRAARQKVLELLGIAHLEHTPTAALSGGERRRAELVLALVRGPRCLLADEPFRGIDPHDAEVVRGALVELARSGCAVVLTGHEMTWMLEVGDRFVWVREGSTEPLGGRAEAERHWRFRRDYLGT